jgi:hypothetical protein
MRRAIWCANLGSGEASAAPLLAEVTMGSSHVIGHHGGVGAPRVSALALALGLDALSALVFVCVLVYAVGRSRGVQDAGNETFFSDPAPAVLLLTAATVAIAAGIIAGVSLARARLHSRAGRWATGLALANALLIPVGGVSVTAGAWLVGYDLPEGWGQPIVPFWMGAGLAAAMLGAVAKEPGRRGVLVVPFMIGALVLTFWLGEILAPH